MESSSIYHGDFVLVDPTASIANHDIVVLSLPDGTMMVKHFRKKGKHLFFYPFSVDPPPKPSYRPLDEATVLGKVVAIIANHKKRKTEKP